MKKRVYLAGAMSVYNNSIYSEHNYAKEWRKEATKLFDDYGCKVIDPTKYFSYEIQNQKSEKEIMKFELKALKESAVMLVNLKDIEESIGTIDEVLYAWVNNIPIIGFYDYTDYINDEEIFLKSLHPWLLEQIDRIEFGEDSMQTAIQYITEYYGDWR